MKILIFVRIRVRNEIITRGKAICGSFNYLRAIIASASERTVTKIHCSKKFIQ